MIIYNNINDTGTLVIMNENFSIDSSARVQINKPSLCTFVVLWILTLSKTYDFVRLLKHKEPAGIYSRNRRKVSCDCVLQLCKSGIEWNRPLHRKLAPSSGDQLKLEEE